MSGAEQFKAAVLSEAIQGTGAADLSGSGAKQGRLGAALSSADTQQCTGK